MKKALASKNSGIDLSRLKESLVRVSAERWLINQTLSLQKTKEPAQKQKELKKR